jgi:sugar phosphate isomerase/epimerase
MAIKRGVSLYSYQQSQYLKELDLEGMVREVGQNLHGADGIEMVDEMSLRYPDPGPDFTRQWFEWMDTYGTTPVALDVGMDVLQFRDHVMTYDECADRLRHDMHLAKRLGFSNVRVLSVVPIEILQAVLPLAEELNLKLGKEIHQPMALEGPEVTEILELADRTGSKHLGVVPDLGIFGFRPSEVQLAWFQQRGAQASACDAAGNLAVALRGDTPPFSLVDMTTHTAGSLRAEYTRFRNTGSTEADFAEAFHGAVAYTDEHVENPQDIDYTVVAEALMLSNTSADTLRDIAQYVTHIHGKFNNMSEIPGEPGHYQDLAIDYPSVIKALKEGGFDGYINTEYEGQRYFQDLEREFLQSEVEQVRRHQEMLRRLLSD